MRTLRQVVGHTQDVPGAEYDSVGGWGKPEFILEFDASSKVNLFAGFVKKDRQRPESQRGTLGKHRQLCWCGVGQAVVAALGDGAEVPVSLVELEDGNAVGADTQS
jgi:hypothetical protein